MTNLVYPAPGIVVGVGRFGLAVLEKLGEDWQQLKLSGAGPSCENLRLFWVHPEQDDEGCWREIELPELNTANYSEDGDWPSIVLDFVLLRTMGLIRYRHGIYQVASPRDCGPVRTADLEYPETKDKEDPEAEEAKKDREEDKRLVRRRFFDWLDLAPDPVEAAERLKKKAEREPVLHLFISPLLHRVRQGHSPWILMAAILRCSCLRAGRDPSPWRWVREQEAQGKIDQEAIQTVCEDRDRFLDRFAPAPLKPSPQPEVDEGEVEGRKTDVWKFEETEIVIPKIFRPQEGDPEPPIDTFHLLRENWQVSGWATDLETQKQQGFKPLQVSHFRLGLFDHCQHRESREPELTKAFEKRLKCTSRLLHRGLVRLWVDLKREQVEEQALATGERRHRLLDEALQQSLKILEKLVVDPLKDAPGKEKEGECLSDLLRCPVDLPDQPTQFLRNQCFDPDSRWLRDSALERRLVALGLGDPWRAAPRRRGLFQEVILEKQAEGGCAPGESDDRPRCTEIAKEPKSAGEGRGRFRKQLNQTVRELLDFSYLGRYRERLTRTPPRLTVFVVGDMSEPFTRIKMQQVLKDVHSELLRAFSSVFELNRDGFDRALSVMPILWMPHPADPFGGEEPLKTRLEEAVIIDAVHGIRRWVEAVLPGARRRISQIFINSRVTDNAVLSMDDSVNQTRDFLSFQLRNDLSRDDWLRRTAVGPGGDDYFASFACCEIEFPAERAREYLANRIARDCLRQLQVEAEWRGREAVKVPDPSSMEELVGEASSRLQQETEREAKGLTDAIWNALPQGESSRRCMPRKEILSHFSERFESRLWADITRLWRQLTQRRGHMDDFVDSLRHQISRQLHGALPDIRRQSDDEVYQASGQGIQAALSRLQERRWQAFKQLQEAEEERLQAEEACQQNQRPNRGRLSRARLAVTEAAKAKPDCGPQRFGLLAWGLLAPITAVLPARLLESELGWWALPLVIVLLIVLAGVSLWALTRHRYRQLQAAIETMASAVHRMVSGGSDSSLVAAGASLRSFLETRLRLTAALARRGFSLHVFEQAAVDEALGLRLRESVDIQLHKMMRRAESLKVRPGGASGNERDDLRDLFVRRAGERVEKLIDPDHLLEYYHTRVRPDDVPVQEFIEQVGGLQDWRRTACLSDSTAVMAWGQELFTTLVDKPITELDYFTEAVGEQLRRFVLRNYSNIGFGAKFLGYEGLDPDGIRLVADASLVADQALLHAYAWAVEQQEDHARRNREVSRAARTLETIAAKVRPNAAYMLSLVQGVRAHSVHNLKRFESFHDRPEGPDSDAIHYLTGYEEKAKEFYQWISAEDAAPRARQDENTTTASSGEIEDHGPDVD